MKNKYNLPDLCFAENITEPGKIVVIKYGESGYYDSEYTGDCMELNEGIGVTEEQMRAMVAGSMFGWDVPGANPEFYTKLKSKSK